jgi:hypothetical protein
LANRRTLNKNSVADFQRSPDIEDALGECFARYPVTSLTFTAT